MKNIAIYGAGGFGREVQMLIEQLNQIEPVWNIIGFYDDGMEKGKIINGIKILGGTAELDAIETNIYLVFAIGNPITKKRLVDSINNVNIKFPTLIHPNVQIGSYNAIGEGSIITAGNIITVNTNIGKHVILNLSCTVGHDTIIGDYCSCMPATNISGEVNMSACVYVGTGVKIINQVDIGENSIIGAGAVVSKSIPDNCTAVGIPARPIKFHKESVS